MAAAFVQGGEEPLDVPFEQGLLGLPDGNRLSSSATGRPFVRIAPAGNPPLSSTSPVAAVVNPDEVIRMPPLPHQPFSVLTASGVMVVKFSMTGGHLGATTDREHFLDDVEVEADVEVEGDVG
ncbi:hypothetical protein [Streptomyces sp. SID12501]|uniref:Uncharacterized protein n=1 Tax=Streptomyces sp. SID12501 TaxID=2706042 RepID=A0A6B3BG87_9ACTN|nr:hypothetical protein [Streptomyces sp. SID12501]NEC85497.1 hypothetical protein [Streptomyces sp. SID12501]